MSAPGRFPHRHAGLFPSAERLTALRRPGATTGAVRDRSRRESTPSLSRAVLTYREFVRPSDQLLDDESWRALIAKGQTPPAPPFTRSFYAETPVAELLKRLRARRDDENPNYGDTRDLLWQIGSRATAQDLAALFDLMTQAGDNNDLANGLGEIISRLPWESRQNDLIQLLDSSNYNLANAAARILLSRPEAMDAAALTSAFAGQSPHGRRLICVLLSRLPQQADATRELLLQALRDPADGVRWQGVLAIYKAGGTTPRLSLRWWCR